LDYEKKIPRSPHKKMSTPTLARAMACAHPSPVDMPPYGPRPDKFPPHPPHAEDPRNASAVEIAYATPTAQEHVGMGHDFLYEINLTPVL